MFQFRVLIVLLICFCFEFALRAQEKGVARFEIIGAKSQQLSFKFINNLIVIPLILNDSDTMNFILDTGLKTTLVTQIAEKDSLSLNFARELTIKGLGEEEDLRVIHAVGNTIRIKNLYGSNLDCLILKDDRFDFSGEMGMEIHGLVGSDIFKNLIVEIDYPNEIIRFHNPEFFKYKKKYQKYSRYPLIFHGEKPYLILPVVQKNGQKFNAKLLLDTGSSDALWLFPDNDPFIEIPDKSRYSFLGKGLNGKIFGYQSRVDSVFVCNAVLHDVSASFPNTSAVKYSRLQDLQGRNGSLGSEFLRRFHVVFDYPNATILLKTNDDFAQPFNFNMAGFDVQAPFKTLPFYTVSSVRDGSPAALSGIKQGDELEEINHSPALKYTLSEVNSLLHAREGAVLRLRLNRNGESYKVKLILTKDL